jgi:hypothetical protein
MFNTGKCPKCEKRIDHLDLDSITMGNRLLGPLHTGVSAVCPHCKCVVSAAIDPIALKTDIVKEVLAGLGVKPKRQTVW